MHRNQSWSHARYYTAYEQFHINVDSDKNGIPISGKQHSMTDICSNDSGARFTKYLTIYRKIILSSSQDQLTIVTFKHAKIVLTNSVS